MLCIENAYMKYLSLGQHSYTIQNIFNHQSLLQQHYYRNFRSITRG